MEVKLVATLDQLLKEKGLNQKELVELIKEKTGENVRPAAISEFYNNQRKSLNKELIEQIANVLEIKDISKLIKFEVKKDHS